MNRRFIVAHVQVALGALVWGAWPLFTRDASSDPLWGVAIALGATAIAASPFLARRKARGVGAGMVRRRSAWWLIALLSVVSAGSLIFLFAAVLSTTVAIGTIGHCSAPILVAVFAPTVLGTRRRRSTIPLAVIASGGVVVATAPWNMSGDGSTLVGAILGVIGAVFAAATVLVHKKLEERFTPEERLVYHAALAAAVVTLLAILLQRTTPTGTQLVRFAMGGALVGAMGSMLYLRGLRTTTAETAGMISLLEPLSAIALAWIVWGEAATIAAAVGGTVMLAATAVAIRLETTVAETDRAHTEARHA